MPNLVVQKRKQTLGFVPIVLNTFSREKPKKRVCCIIEEWKGEPIKLITEPGATFPLYAKRMNDIKMAYEDYGEGNLLQPNDRSVTDYITKRDACDGRVNVYMQHPWMVEALDIWVQQFVDEARRIVQQT